MIRRVPPLLSRRWGRTLGSKAKKKKNDKSKGKDKSSSPSKSIGREAQILAQSGMESEQGAFGKTIEKVLNAPPRKKPKYSEEELAEHYAIGRTYNIEMVRWHNKTNKAFYCRIKLKNDAIKNLPDQIRALAEQAPQATFPPTPLPIYHPSLLPFGREDAVKNKIAF